MSALYAAYDYQAYMVARSDDNDGTYTEYDSAWPSWYVWYVESTGKPAIGYWL